MLFLVLFSQISVSCASSQANQLNERDILEIGHEFFLEIVPAEFATMDSDKLGTTTNEEWIVIPAVYETITETIEVSAAYNEIELLSPVYDLDGSLKPARALLKAVPAVTRERSRRVVKIPPKIVKRVVPVLDGELTVRKQIKPVLYIIRDRVGTEIERYDSATELVDYINSRD